MVVNKQRTPSNQSEVLSLPGDCVLGRYPKNVQDWFVENGLTNQDLLDYDVTWSESRKAVVFPYYTMKGQLFAYQERTFNGDPRKWLTFGNIGSHVLTYSPDDDPTPDLCVVVEDIVSAIRVGHVATVMPLFGTALDEKHTAYLLDFYRRVIFWLDADAVPKAMLHSRKFSTLGGPLHDAYVLKTEGDPKSYSQQQIVEFINTTLEDEDDVDESLACAC